MFNFGNIDQVADEFIWKDQAGLVTKELGESAGSQKIYVNMDTVPPGAFSTKYHSHSQQEEFFFVLSGTGTLRMNDENRAVKQGDFVAKPAGKDLFHTFYNSGSEPLVILDVGTREEEDTCYYPDEEIYLHKANGKHHIFKNNMLLENWSSDPNE